jgi:signal transduction histidine kinase
MRLTAITGVGLAMAAGFSWFSCSGKERGFPVPDEQPYKLVEVSEIDPGILYVDLNLDGRDEQIRVNDPDNPLVHGGIVVMTYDGKTVEQANYAGEVKPLHFLDYDGDGVLEILVPFLRNDSLFVGFLNSRGQKLFYFLLTTGEPRREDNAVLPWDPGVQDFYLADVNADGRAELISVINTEFARMPRGIFIHSLPDGQLLGKKIVGSALRETFLGDFDGDGRLEIIVQTSAPNNGAKAGGFDDAHSYLIVFDLSLPPRVTWWREMGGLWTSVRVDRRDFDGDGRLEFLAFTSTHSSRPGEGRIELIQPGTWRTYQQRPLPEALRHPQVLDLDRDARPEILASNSQGEIWVFDSSTFEVVRRRRLDLQFKILTLLPDVDEDGVEEIVALTTPEGIVLLGPDLRVKAALPGGSIRSTVQRGLGTPPYLLGMRDGKTILFRLARNPFYLWKRYGAVPLWLFSVGLVAAVLMGIHSLRRRNRLLELVQARLVAASDQGVLLLRPDFRIAMMNGTLRHWLGLNGLARRPRARFDEVLEPMPSLVSFLQQTTAIPAHHHEGFLDLELEGVRRQVRVVADPIPLDRNQKPHWLVVLEDRSREAELQRTRTWGMMARRVAHDIKNPLTSILLTLQRLQMEYRERCPEAATEFDSYSSRIIERIEYLRRVTRNFMKFVNIERPNLVEVDLNVFLRSVGETIAEGLPPDIHLDFKLDTELPPVRIDQEQMQSVLENLIANAVNAMPDGGRVTMSTQVAQDLHISGDTQPHSYVVLEVLDTGVGIPDTHRARLFDLDFTESEHGTGVGLAIVKKIVEDHGGHVEVESEMGVGSAFCIYLPITK